MKLLLFVFLISVYLQPALAQAERIKYPLKDLRILVYGTSSCGTAAGKNTSATQVLMKEGPWSRSNFVGITFYYSKHNLDDVVPIIEDVNVPRDAKKKFDELCSNDKVKTKIPSDWHFKSECAKQIKDVCYSMPYPHSANLFYGPTWHNKGKPGSKPVENKRYHISVSWEHGALAGGGKNLENKKPIYREFYRDDVHHLTETRDKFKNPPANYLSIYLEYCILGKPARLNQQLITTASVTGLSDTNFPSATNLCYQSPQLEHWPSNHPANK